MQILVIVLLGCVLLTAAACAEEGMAGPGGSSQTYYPSGSQAPFDGPEEYFTGKVRVEPVFPANEHGGFSGAYVTFEAGARTAWHLHPGGQHMIVTSGVGRTGTWDGEVREIREGDAVWCPPDVKHWHGAAPDRPMTHFVVTGSKDGKNVIWKEKVTDAQYDAIAPREPATGPGEAARALDAEQRSVVAISAFAARGDMEELGAALGRGLDAGLTVSEAKEILVQLYAYAGFPRSLNAIHRLMDVLEKRRAAGVEDEPGAPASPVPEDLDRDAYGARVRARLAGREEDAPPAAWQEFAPAIDTFLKEHLFADVFARDVLDDRTRELVTVAALAAMTGTEGQLRFHLGAALNVGWTAAELQGAVAVLAHELDDAAASRTSSMLEAVLEERK